MDWTKIDTLRNDGKEAFSNKDYDKAFECCTEGIELINLGHNSAATIIHSNIAQTELMKKDYSSAIEHANKSLELSPSFKKSMLRRAIANCELKNCDEAMKDLRYLFKYEPTNPQVITLMRRCSDLPKMKQELRIAYASYYFRKALQKSCQNYETPLHLRLADVNLGFSLLRQMFLSLKNSEFVSQLLFDVCVTPCIDVVQLLLKNWFAIQIVKLNLPSIQKMVLSERVFKILFHLAQPGTFNLLVVMPLVEEKFGPWSRYSSICYSMEKKELDSSINANDLRVIEQKAEIWTRLVYLQQIVKFKNSNFSNLRELVFVSATSPDMKFLKLWQKKQWLIKQLIFCNTEPRLETFKRFDGILSKYVVSLYIPFANNNVCFTKDIYHRNLSNDLAVFKRLFPNLAEVNVTQDYTIDIETFSSFIQNPFKEFILEVCSAIDYKPEWCSNLQFLINIVLYNVTVHKIKRTTLEMLKNAVNSYRHDLGCVKNLHFAGPCVSKFKYSSCCASLFTLGFETHAAHFEINFLFNL